MQNQYLNKRIETFNRMNKVFEVRKACQKCGRLLCKTVNNLVKGVELKCPFCNEMNYF